MANIACSSGVLAMSTSWMPAASSGAAASCEMQTWFIRDKPRLALRARPRKCPRFAVNSAKPRRFRRCGRTPRPPRQGFGGLRCIDFDRLDGMTNFGEAVLEVRFAVASGKIDETAGGREACGDFPRESFDVWANQWRAVKTPLARGCPRPLADQEQRQEAARLGQRPVRLGG